MKSNSIKMNKQQKNSIIYACAIGDGCVRLRKSGLAFLQITHGLKQAEYLKWKIELLKNALNQKELKIHYCNGKDYYIGSKLYTGKKAYVWTKFTKKWTKVYRFLYKNGHKRINRYCLNRLDARGLAIWYMDDGSLNNQKIINLNTYTKDYSEHVGIKKWFKEKWNIDVKIIFRPERNNAYYIWINNTNSKKLINIIAPYVLEIPDMVYKIDMKYKRNRGNNLNYNLNRLSELYGNIEKRTEMFRS